MSHCQKCNDTDFALFGNVECIFVIRTSRFTMGAMTAQTLTKVTNLPCTMVAVDIFTFSYLSTSDSADS